MLEVLYVMIDMVPDIVQVVPQEDYTVAVYFCDGKCVIYDVKPKINDGIFRQLQTLSFFINNCKIMNDTLAWDISGNNDETKCIDIDPDYLYSLQAVDEPSSCISQNTLWQ